MTQSDAIDQLAVAMAKSQALLEPAHFDKVNPHYKSKFASLSSVMKAAKIYAANGISYTQLPMMMRDPGDTEAKFCLLLTIMHTSGQWMKSIYPLPEGLNPQQLGSALTYAKRYQLASALAISADDDDDGNAASSKVPAKSVLKITEEQVVTLAILADEVGVENIKAFCDYMGVSKLNDLPANRYQDAVKALEEKKMRDAAALEKKMVKENTKKKGDTDVSAG